MVGNFWRFVHIKDNIQYVIFLEKLFKMLSSLILFANNRNVRFKDTFNDVWCAFLLKCL